MKMYYVFVVILVGYMSFAQVGINTTTPDPSAMLDIEASDKGILIPRVSLTDVTVSMLDGTNTAAPGLLIYNTNASVSGGDGVGFYSFNGTIWEKIITSGASGIGADADFFEVGTTEPPDAITDNVYRNGDVFIGNGTAIPGKLAITQSEGNQTAVTINHISNFSGASFPTHSSLRINSALNNPSTSALAVYGTYIDTSPTNSSTGSITASGNWLRFNGDQNMNRADVRQFLGNSSTQDIGSRNDFQNTNSSAGMAHLGTYNYFYNNTSGNKGGLLNTFGNAVGYGLFGNEWYGVNNYFQNDDTTISKIGLKNTFIGNALDSYGIYNDWSSASTTVAYNKYGIYTNIPSTAAGTHYGIYNDVRSTSGFAAYFLGRVAVGDSETTNYVFPTSRGTNGQVMQTDGSGNVNWVDTSSITNAWTLSGNAGTDPSSNFIGTTDSNDLTFRTNNLQQWRMSTKGQWESLQNRGAIYIGENAGENDLSAGFTFDNFASVFIGKNAGSQNTTGLANIAIGPEALENNSVGNGNVAIGSRALQNTTSANNTAVGESALDRNTIGENNTALGGNSLGNNIDGSYNLALGYFSGVSNVSGSYNSFVGWQAGRFNTTGWRNFYGGALSGWNNDTGNGNVMIGNSAGLYLTNSSENVVLGYEAMSGTVQRVGNRNTILGRRAGFNSATSGSVFIGYFAGVGITEDNRFEIETSFSNPPLLYGEFDNDILRTNAEFQIGDPSITGYAFPAIDGTTNQIMQTDGNGNMSWVDMPSSSFWNRTGTILNLANAGDDIQFTSNQTSITFPANGAGSDAIFHLFSSGTINSDRMVFSQSPTFSNWGLMYRDTDDSFRFLRGGLDRVVVNLGTGNPLVVNGTAEATAFQSATTTYPDYVFESYFEGASEINPAYSFQSLDEIFNFIKKNGHLPGVKSFEEVKADGMQFNLTETSLKNLEKIEELFLYAYQLQQENEQLKNNQKKLAERLERLEKLVLKE
ncbi:MAG: hypothetical protein R3359_02580 [Marinirhabdus sp.]|nr:hypothetical protein [Marinirhabdus sp.]